jgi:solute carrier family 25 carnitine/acylcarnitine transporter 20/29
VIKVRMQVMPDKYSSTLSCARTIWKHEGIAGFFKGVWAPAYAQFVMGSLAFAGNEVTKKLLEPNLKPGEAIQPVNGYIAGCVGGFMQCTVLAPTDVVKCRMQVSNVGTNAPNTLSSQPAYAGTMDCAMKVLRVEGLGGLYRGFRVTCLRDVPSWGIYFLAYEEISTFMINKMKLSENFSILMGGGIAGSLSWLCVYPMDVIKTNMQIQQGKPPAGPNGQVQKMPMGILDTGRHLVEKHGIRIFTRGLGM